jgi:hypothetical protein
MPQNATPGRAALRLLALAAVLAAGCNSTADITGKVTYKGAPLSGGSLTLVASDGNVFSAQLLSDGTFTITGVPTGDAKIAVVGGSPGAGVKQPPAGRGGPRAAAAGRGGPKENSEAAPPEPAGPPPGPVLPSQYGDPNSSGLTVKVKAGQPINIDLQ